MSRPNTGGYTETLGASVSGTTASYCWWLVKNGIAQGVATTR